MVFGISIGNTNVSSAVCQSNRVSVIANAGGEHRSRSVVAKNNEDPFSVGTAAISSRNTVLFDNIVKNYELNGGKHTLTKQSGGLTINTRVDSCLGALIGEISETCRDALSSGESAVLAVPDHWDNEQVNGFKSIFESVSKFTVNRTLCKSVAAWLAIKQNGKLTENEIEPTKDGKERILVIRIGGTSSSATILEEYNGLVSKIESSEFETGADLVVKSICEMLAKEATRKLRCDVTESKKSIQKLEKEARRAVEVMSNKDTVAVQIESLFEGMDFQTSINRGRVEALAPYKQVTDPIFSKYPEADRIIVVGGGGKSPKVQSLIRGKYGNEAVVIAPNCEELVPIGCAIQASIISSSNEVTCEVLPSKLPLSPLSLVLKSESGSTSLINKFAPLPCSFNVDCSGNGEIISTEVDPNEALMTGLEGHVTGSFTETGLSIKNNEKSFELLF